MINKIILIWVLKSKETLKLTSDNYCKFVETHQVFDASLKTGSQMTTITKKKTQKRKERLRSECKMEKKKTIKKDKLT